MVSLSDSRLEAGASSMEDVVERRFIPHFGFIIYLPLVKAI